LGNKSLKEQISRTKELFVENKAFGRLSADSKKSNYFSATQQDSTAYVWTGHMMAMGKYPEVKHIVTKREEFYEETIRMRSSSLFFCNQAKRINIPLL
jgi:hypothetical protein